MIEGEEYFEVQEVSSRRYNKRSKTYEYRIRFRGFEETESQWLPFEDLSESCLEMLEEYDAKNPKK